MRLICTLQDQIRANQLSSYLTKQGIENQVESSSNTDWGSADYGIITSQIWIINENDLDRALEISKDYVDNPQEEKFQFTGKDTPSINPEVLPPEEPRRTRGRRKRKIADDKPPLSPITSYLLFICCLLYLFSSLSEPTFRKTAPNIPLEPIAYSPVQKELLYDYPHAFEIIDQIVNIYGVDSLTDPSTLPEPGQHLLQKYESTPYWKGVYDVFMQHNKDPAKGWNFDAPMFEKIRQGEWWRLFSPCLLHGSFIHILFNMIWLIILGQQMEKRLGGKRYLLFILATGILSNTAQYLMSGAGFLGISGVICAMVGYIWARQKKAPWEGYPVDRSTFTFIFLYVVFLFGLQFLSFFLEIFGKEPLAVGIGNTAHITGGIIGYFLGLSKLFSWK